MSSKRRYGPSVDCLCCGAAWVSTDDFRGYPCDCTWEWHCRHSGKCPVHCTGEMSEREQMLAAACQLALEALDLEGKASGETGDLLRAALKDRNSGPEEIEG